MVLSNIEKKTVDNLFQEFEKLTTNQRGLFLDKIKETEEDAQKDEKIESLKAEFYSDKFKLANSVFKDSYRAEYFEFIGLAFVKADSLGKKVAIAVRDKTKLELTEYEEMLIKIVFSSQTSEKVLLGLNNKETKNDLKPVEEMGDLFSKEISRRAGVEKSLFEKKTKSSKKS